MGRIFRIVAALLVVLFLNTGRSNAGFQPPAKGEELPEFTLAVPKSEVHQSYLGVSGKEVFSIPEIRAEVVIIQIFSMY
jgi:hypothetical protein